MHRESPLVVLSPLLCEFWGNRLPGPSSRWFIEPPPGYAVPLMKRYLWASWVNTKTNQLVLYPLHQDRPLHTAAILNAGMGVLAEVKNVKW